MRHALPKAVLFVLRDMLPAEWAVRGEPALPGVLPTAGAEGSGKGRGKEGLGGKVLETEVTRDLTLHQRLGGREVYLCETLHVAPRLRTLY